MTAVDPSDARVVGTAAEADPDTDVSIDLANIDFDLFDAEFVRDPFPTYAHLRGACPVAHTDRWGGQWMPTRYEDIEAIARNSEQFSSITVSVTGPKPGEGSLFVGPPVTLDPPQHAPARRLLLPAFSPKAIERLTPITRDIARDLIAEIVERGGDATSFRADAAIDYAQHLPVRVIAGMIGIPVSQEPQFTDWVVRILKDGATDLEVQSRAGREVREYFAERIEEHRADPSPPDDLITYLINAEVDGAPLPPKHVIGILYVLLLAGIDTTWSSLGSSLWHLATHSSRPTCSSMRARLEPRQRWMPSPNVAWRLTVRSMTASSGCSKTSGSRLAAGNGSSTRSPGQRRRPPTSTSSVTMRAMVAGA